MEVFKVRPEDKFDLFKDPAKHSALLDHVLGTTRTVDHTQTDWQAHAKYRRMMISSDGFTRDPLTAAKDVLNHAVMVGVANTAAESMYDKLIQAAFRNHYTLVGHDGEFELYVRTIELYDKANAVFSEISKVFQRLYYTAKAAYMKTQEGKKIMQPLSNQSNHVDVQYKALVSRILTEGRLKGDRTGTGTLSLFGAQMRFNLAEGFPLLTTKKVNLRSIIHELLWFLDGKTNAKDLDCGIWDDWQVTAETIVMKWLDDSDRETKLAIRDVLDMSDIYRVVKSERAVEAVLTELKEETGNEWFAIKVSSQSTECGIKGYWDTALDRCIEKGLIPVHVLGDLGELGPVYGKVWRSWLTQSGDTIDQIQEIVDSLKNDPDSRRMLVSGWNPELLPDTKYSPDRNALEGKQALPPCHTMFQFYSDDCTLEERIAEAESILRRVDSFGGIIKLNQIRELYTDWINGAVKDDDISGEMTDTHTRLLGELDSLGVPKKRLSCQLYMRSNDVGLGWSFNVASYALLVMIVARQVGMAYGDFVWTGGDVHIYQNHLAGLEEQMMRQERQMPTMKINRPIGTAFDDYKPEDFILENYDPHPAIKFPIAV